MIQFPGNELNKETNDSVYFYTPAFYALDNFSAHVVKIWGRKFRTAEHAYQWKKYADSAPGIAEQIFSAASPTEVKKISDANKTKADANFSELKFEVMEEILRAKTIQHEDVPAMLRETGNRQILENSPTDGVWGIGIDGTGQNMLGTIWMKIRRELA